MSEENYIIHFCNGKKFVSFEDFKSLEQQLREKESCCNCEYHLTKQANEKIDALTTKLSEAEARVKELEAQDKRNSKKCDLILEDIKSLQSRLAQELERGKLKDAVVESVKKWKEKKELVLRGMPYTVEFYYQEIELIATLTALNESEGKGKL